MSTFKIVQALKQKQVVWTIPHVLLYDRQLPQHFRIFSNARRRFLLEITGKMEFTQPRH
jgi:hypothetical protein